MQVSILRRGLAVETAVAAHMILNEVREGSGREQGQEGNSDEPLAERRRITMAQEPDAPP
jgi:hypothetical protein